MRCACAGVCDERLYALERTNGCCTGQKEAHSVLKDSRSYGRLAHGSRCLTRNTYKASKPGHTVLGEMSVVPLS